MRTANQIDHHHRRTCTYQKMLAKPKFEQLPLEQMYRGEAPDDLEEQCLRLCRNYLGGVWLQATSVEAIQVDRIFGGLTNQLYRVGLKANIEESVIEKTKIPLEVTIRFYQSKHQVFISKEMENNGDEHLSDSILATIFSNIGISPRIYGMFTEGTILAYIKHEQFRRKHQTNDHLLRQLAEHLAVIHSSEVPLVRPQENVHKQTIKAKIERAYQVHDIPRLVDELDLTFFRARDLQVEVQDFCKILDDIDAPMVLCHNDFRGNNLLVIEEENETKVLVCDYDYAGYGPRGFDFATLFHEWGNDRFEFENGRPLPSGPLETFIEYYIDKMDTLCPGFSKQPKNSLATIKKEAKVYQLANIMFFLGFATTTTKLVIKSLVYDENNSMKRADRLYGRYLALKKMLIEDGTIEKS